MTTDKEKLSGYFHCDMTVRKDPNLTDIAKLIFGDLAYFYFLREGKCTAVNKFFADKYDKSDGTISKAVSDLVKAGYIIRYLDEYRNRTIFVNRKAFSKENGNSDLQDDDSVSISSDPNDLPDNPGPITPETMKDYPDYSRSNKFSNFFNDGKSC